MDKQRVQADVQRGRILPPSPAYLLACLLFTSLRGFCDGAAVRAFGCVGIVPFNFVGDEWRATAAALNWQGSALQCKLIGHLRGALPRFVQR